MGRSHFMNASLVTNNVILAIMYICIYSTYCSYNYRELNLNLKVFSVIPSAAYIEKELIISSSKARGKCHLSKVLRFLLCSTLQRVPFMI